MEWRLGQVHQPWVASLRLPFQLAPEVRLRAGTYQGEIMINRPLKPRGARAFALTTAAVLALTLSACGPSDSSSPPAATDGKQLTKVRVANSGMIPSSLDLVWGQEGGFFQKHGLDVTLNPPQLSAAESVNTLISGNADLSITSGSVVPSARSAGRKLTIVATTQVPIPLNIAFTPEVDRKLRDQGLSENSSVGDLLAALKGLTLATSSPGSANVAAYRYLLAQYGLNPERDNITLTPMADVASQIAALSNKRVDGIASGLGGAATGAKAQGVGVLWNLAEMKGSEPLKAIPYVSIVATEDTIKNHPELIQSFLDAFYETQQSMLKGLTPDESASLKKIVGATMDEKVYNETISGLERLFPDSYVTTDASWDALRKVAEVTSQGTLNVPAADAVNNSFAEKVKR